MRRTASTATTASRSRSRSWPASSQHNRRPGRRPGQRSTPEGSTNGFGAHIADVEVDPETGKVTILRYTAIQDAGKAVHPSYVEGQMQGGAVQGIGWALNEEYFFDDAGPDAERQLPRLPHADLPRRADDRNDHRRSAQSRRIPSASAASAKRRSSRPPPPIANAIYHATGMRLHRAADVAAEGVEGAIVVVGPYDMPRVFIPAQLRDLTGGQAEIEVDGRDRPRSRRGPGAAVPRHAGAPLPRR